MGPIRNPRWEQKRTEGYVIVSIGRQVETKGNSHKICLIEHKILYTKFQIGIRKRHLGKGQIHV